MRRMIWIGLIAAAGIGAGGVLAAAGGQEEPGAAPGAAARRGADAAPFTGKVLPVFYVSDVQRSVAFYAAAGFEFHHYFDYDAGAPVTEWTKDEAPIWAEMAAGSLSFGLHRVAAGAPLVVGGTRHYFIVEDAAAHHRRVTAAGIEAGDLRERPWMTMFRIEDPDGHEIWIGQER